MPVNSIWEGSGNVMCLDVMRVLGRHADVITLLNDEFEAVKGSNRHFDRRWRQLRLQLTHVREGMAREVTQELLQLASAAILLKVAEPPLADGWCDQHLDMRGRRSLSEDLCTRLLLRASAG